MKETKKRTRAKPTKIVRTNKGRDRSKDREGDKDRDGGERRAMRMGSGACSRRDWAS